MEGGIPEMECQQGSTTDWMGASSLCQSAMSAAVSQSQTQSPSLLEAEIMVVITRDCRLETVGSIRCDPSIML